LAVLAAYDLAVNFSIKVNMYSFGGPRVGNPSFRQHYDTCVPTSYRVVMDGDIVPGWPKFVCLTRLSVACQCSTVTNAF
jgi:predicted lipase